MYKNLLNIKVVILAFAMNLAYLFYFFYFILPKELSGINYFIFSLIWYPIAVLIATITFVDFRDKIIFNLLSLASIYLMLALEIINTFFDAMVFGLFVVYIFLPFFNARIAQLISKYIIKGKNG